MRRLWFKKEMRQAILDGKKVSTTRDHELPIERAVLAVSGSRFKAEPFAVLWIYDKSQMTVRSIMQLFYSEEGFNSPEEATAYAKKNNLLQTRKPVWYHKFKIVEVRVKKEGADRL